MKCICGYERLYNYQTDDGKEVGDKDFITINGTFTINDYKNYFSDIGEVSLKACPECGTIQMCR